MEKSVVVIEPEIAAVILFQPDDELVGNPGQFLIALDRRIRPELRFEERKKPADVLGAKRLGLFSRYFGRRAVENALSELHVGRRLHQLRPQNPIEKIVNEIPLAKAKALGLRQRLGRRV